MKQNNTKDHVQNVQEQKSSKISNNDLSDMRQKNYEIYHQFLNRAPVVQSQINKNLILIFLKIFQYIVTVNPSERTNDEIKFLVNYTQFWPFFQNLIHKQLADSSNHENFCRNILIQSFDPGQIIFRQGEQPNYFYFIISGQVNIYKHREQVNNSSQILILQQKIEAELLRESQQILQKREGKSQKKYSIRRKIIHIKMRRILQVFIRSSLPFNTADRQSENEKGQFKLNDEQKLKIIRDYKEQQKIMKAKEIILNKKISNILGDLPLENVQNLDFFFNLSVPLQDYIVTLGENQFFGELGILYKKRRAATVVSKTKLVVALLSATLYGNVFREKKLKKINNEIKLFKESLHLTIPDRQILKQTYNFGKKKYYLNQIIYRENDPVKEVYIIKKGEIEISKQNGQIKIGIVLLGMGNIFGESDYFYNLQNRGNTAQCKSDTCKIYSIQLEVFNILYNMEYKKKYFNLQQHFQNILENNEVLKEQMISKFFNRMDRQQNYPIKKLQLNDELNNEFSDKLSILKNNHRDKHVLQKLLINIGSDMKEESKIEKQIFQNSTKNLIQQVQSNIQFKLNLQKQQYPFSKNESYLKIQTMFQDIQKIRTSVQRMNPMVSLPTSPSKSKQISILEGTQQNIKLTTPSKFVIKSNSTNQLSFMQQNQTQQSSIIEIYVNHLFYKLFNQELKTLYFKNNFDQKQLGFSSSQKLTESKIKTVNGSISITEFESSLPNKFLQTRSLHLKRIDQQNNQIQLFQNERKVK